MPTPRRTASGNRTNIAAGNAASLHTTLADADLTEALPPRGSSLAKNT